MVLSKYCMLMAEVHSCYTFPGEWVAITWQIYSDGSWKMQIEQEPEIDEFPEWDNPVLEDIEDFMASYNPEDNYKIPENHIFTKTGIMDQIDFAKLCMAIAKEPWREQGIVSEVLDGEVWRIEYFAPDGTILRSSGDIGYIDGHKVLEEIVDCLPNARE